MRKPHETSGMLHWEPITCVCKPNEVRACENCRTRCVTVMLTDSRAVIVRLG